MIVIAWNNNQNRSSSVNTAEARETNYQMHRTNFTHNVSLINNLTGYLRSAQHDSEKNDE